MSLTSSLYKMARVSATAKKQPARATLAGGPRTSSSAAPWAKPASGGGCGDE
jgi:hypothetical protein